MKRNSLIPRTLPDGVVQWMVNADKEETEDKYVVPKTLRQMGQRDSSKARPVPLRSLWKE